MVDAAGSEAEAVASGRGTKRRGVSVGGCVVVQAAGSAAAVSSACCQARVKLKPGGLFASKYFCTPVA